ncbi:hypothetical protein MVLG_05013 [Microbotryum lychnidis-dioicae p1A1 Lamole]|uniref:Uncharacterized protein n=1 Tax=Microbotryum lychnidis-dioicae (strain p1A1 Lamole / MvSl-1064) TaxID=683840 RepID=U5HCZ0_USTV1|nr:hypothetical protein MVLG_05013 [Microbotryum lychnidis-dioicae p1A1 Lamole]|eukprot:KDE04542.1 hypothetical protein MVLG_05013 [Microbotryum lychnidis-dioicae p1A1 Lamole]
MDSRKPPGNTQPGDCVGYSSDDAEEVSQHLSKFQDRESNSLALLVPLIPDYHSMILPLFVFASL